jgi:hypothetical protein
MSKASVGDTPHDSCNIRFVRAVTSVAVPVIGYSKERVELGIPPLAARQSRDDEMPSEPKNARMAVSRSGSLLTSMIRARISAELTYRDDRLFCYIRHGPSINSVEDAKIEALERAGQHDPSNEGVVAARIIDGEECSVSRGRARDRGRELRRMASNVWTLRWRWNFQ